MDFNIKKNSTLPILKMAVVKDGRNDYQSFMDFIETSSLFFSMVDSDTGANKIHMEPAGFVEKTFTDPNTPVEYYIYFKFQKKHINKVGKFEGQFTLRNESGTLILPIREQLFINVLDSQGSEDINELFNLDLTAVISSGSTIFNYTLTSSSPVFYNTTVNFTHTLQTITGSSVVVTTGVTISSLQKVGSVTINLSGTDYTNLTQVNTFSNVQVLPIGLASSVNITENVTFLNPLPTTTPTPTNTQTPTVTPTQTPTPTSEPTTCNITQPKTFQTASQCVTFNNISLNGLGNNITLNSGDTISIFFDYDVSLCEGDCPGCMVQHYIGLGGTSDQILCLSQSLGAGSVNSNVTIPNTPGLYYIQYTSTLDFSCQPVNFNTNYNYAIACVEVLPILTPTITPTVTPTESETPTVTETPTTTPTPTPTNTVTPTNTITPTPTSTLSSGIITDSLFMKLDATNYTSGVWLDETVNGNNATINGATWSSTDGGIFDLNGASDTISIPHNSNLSLNTTTQRTIQVWVKFDTLPSLNTEGQPVFGKLSSNFSFDGYYGALFSNTSNTRVITNGSGSARITTSTSNPISVNTWYLYTFISQITATANTTKVYINTTEVSSTEHGSDGYSESNPLYLGFIGAGVSSPYLNGKIGSCYFYTKGLNLTEITNNYNVTKSRFGL